MATLTKNSKKINQFYDNHQITLLQQVIESLRNGVLILTETGELIHINSNARKIFNQFYESSANSQLNLVPCPIWHLCQLLIESRTLFSEQSIILSDEVVLDTFNTFRVRGRWLDLEQFNHPCLLVTIDNQNESLKKAIADEVKKYQLTPREAEVWQFYRVNYKYKEIAEHLYITINTVKKHMKSIHAKRQAFIDEEC